MSDTLAILSLIVREALSAPRVGRRPEPDTVMEDPESVESFHAEGSAGGALLPVYHFNALATSRLLPRGGTLVDLGSGSGQYLAYLAQCRPDIEIFGLDLSEAMVSHGNRALGAAGLGDRVHLRVADMTNFSGQAPEHTDGLSSVFALHHLPTRDHLQRCLGEVMRVRRRDGCGVWLFDHARPRHPRTPALFPEIFTPDASAIFRQDSRNSLIASFSFAELRECLDAAAAEPCGHTQSKFLRLYQAHWLEPVDRSVEPPGWTAAALPAKAQEEFRRLCGILAKVPLHRVAPQKKGQGV